MLHCYFKKYYVYNMSEFAFCCLCSSTMTCNFEKRFKLHKSIFLYHAELNFPAR